MFDLSGNSALITGASGGIGAAIARALHASGATVVLHGTRAERLAALAEELGERAHVVTANLSERAEAAGLVDAAAEVADAPISILVNNAGISPKSPSGSRLDTVNTTIEDWRHVYQVNVFAPIMLTQALVEPLTKGGGAVVNVTSIAGSRVHEFAGSAYATSKAALSALTREMASDFGKLGIRVNAIAPGEILTNILSPGSEEAILPQIPLGRFGTPDEVAETIYFLCSDKAKYMNGSEIHINGGQHV